jgi:site-specific DNA recombinase
VAATAPARPRPRGKRRRPVAFLGDRPAAVRRIAVYLRRSTDDEHQPFSISAQEAALLNYIASQSGWTLVAKYSDDASGATTGRPDLQRALQAARAGRFDVLLVVRVDRFSRRLSDLLALLAELDDAGVAFVSATEPFDTSTSIGRMLVQLLGVFAEFERETIIDRVTKGMAAKAAKGKWPGGTRPYGYWIDRDTHKLVPYPEEAPHLREIFRLYADERLGTRGIAAELNRRGVRNRTGKPWSGHTVARILANPAYAGDIAHGDVYVEDAHEALIDRQTWQHAASIAAERADPQTQRAASNGGYDLTGKITCPGCGHKYIGTSATGRSRTYRYYTCFSRVRYGTHGCNAVRLPADDTDTAVLHALANFYTQAPGLITDAVTRAQARHRDGYADRHAEAGALQSQIKAKQAAIDQYFTAFENGTMDDTTAGLRVNALRTEIDQLQARHHEITDTIGDEPAAPAPHTIAQLGAYLHDILDAGTPAERKAVIEALIAEIRITEEGIIPVFRIPGPRSPIPGETSTTSTSAVPVRAMVRSVGRLGLEPRTDGLKVRCSAIELTPLEPARPAPSDEAYRLKR